MNYYKVLIEKRLPVRFLTYRIGQTLGKGQVVRVPLRNKSVWGVVIAELNNDNNLEEKKIKEIVEVFPVILDDKQLKFIFNFAYNTFNSVNLALSAVLNPLQFLPKKAWKALEEQQKCRHSEQSEESFGAEQNDRILNQVQDDMEKTDGKSSPGLDFCLESDITFRIITLIRSHITTLLEFCHSEQREESLSTKQNNEILNQVQAGTTKKQILIIFPEKKHLNKVYKEIFSHPDFDSKISSQVDFQIYSGTNSKQSRETTLSLIKNSVCHSEQSEESSSVKQNDGILKRVQDDMKKLNEEINVIFATRSGIFLPYSTLVQIILVDESNSFYIQDQNSLYFDARDAVFLLSQSFSASLTFVSTLPSVRLYSFYSDKVLKEFTVNQSTEEQKRLKIQITKRSGKDAFFDLFSESILAKIDVEYDN